MTKAQLAAALDAAKARIVFLEKQIAFQETPMRLRARQQLDIPIEMYEEDSITLRYCDKEGTLSEVMRDTPGVRATFREVAIFEMWDSLGEYVLGGMFIEPAGEAV